MNGRPFVFFLVLTVLAGPVWPAGEDDKAAAFEAALKSVASTWRIERSEASGKALTYSLVRGEQRLVVSIQSLSQEKAAADLLAAMARRVTARPTEVTGIGVRCLLWADPVTGAASLLFQRSGSVVQVVAPSREEAVELARQLDKSLPR